VAEHLRAVPGVEKVAMAAAPLLGGNSWNDSISVNGGPPSDDLTYFLSVSPGWLEAMKIPLHGGRDFRPGETYPGAAIVNDTFVKRYFKGEDSIGRVFNREEDEGGHTPFQIVGVVRDARYQGLRSAIPPIAYLPFEAAPIADATFIVRTTGSSPLAPAATLRREVSRVRPEFRVSNIRTQLEINQSLTIRERLLAMLAMFFAAVALLLAGVGLYGVLDYSVLQRRREIGIRMAIGARPGSIAGLVTLDVFWMVLAGALAGLAVGMISVQCIASLFFDVKPTDLGILAIPSLAILAAALLAGLPAVIHAVRIDPVEMLRSE
jgi:predicted permease